MRSAPAQKLSGGVWVYVELSDGNPAQVSLELLGAGRSLADTLHAELAAILIGENISDSARELLYWDADRIMVGDTPLARDYRAEVFASIIAHQALQGKPEILLVGATPIGRDLAPRVAAKLNTGCTADCTELRIDGGTRFLVATKPYFGRNLMADILCPDQRPQMATVRPGVMELKTRTNKTRGKLIPIEINLSEPDTSVTVHETLPLKSENTPLEKSDKVVACGMGVGTREGFEAVKKLADLLGACIGATSLPVDEGWVSEDYKIGQTGKTIRPKLYLGCGVSGAIQHAAGIINSELIIAINTNRRAEIFQYADYGIIGDINKIIPALIAKLQRA
ncbi:MAG: electron transfer flavoprotein subunit alpha/FixB family protein [Thermodesulfobacteriota bacterium]